MAFQPRYYLSLYVAAGWLAGIWLGAQITWAVALWLLLGALLVAGAVAGWRRGHLGLVLAALAALAFGAARTTLALNAESLNALRHVANGQEAVIYGTIAEEPDDSDRAARLRVRVEELVIEDRAQPVEGLLLVQTNLYPQRYLGERIRLSGELEPLATLGDDGYITYLNREGIQAQMRYPQIVGLEGSNANRLDQLLVSIKLWAQGIIERSVPEPQASLLVGILLGDDSGMAPDTAEAFRTTGMTHVIAISGFNIALLIALLDAFAKPVLPRRTAALLIAVVIGLYAILVGAAGSVVRAAVMGVVYLFSLRLLGRPTYVVASLLAAAALMAAVDPYVVMDIGFQLSFAATLGLVLYAGPWTRWLANRLTGRLGADTGRRATGLLTEGLVVTLAAQVLALPLILYYFGQLSLISLPANMLVIPAQPGVMFSGGLTVLAGAVTPWLGQIAGSVAWLFLGYTTGVIELLARVPGASVPFQLPAAGLLLIYLGIGVVTFVATRRETLLSESPPADLWSSVRRPVLLTMILGASVVTLLLLSNRPDGRLHVAFLDVGQGDAILITSPAGRQVLVDGGRYPNTLLAELGRQMPFWDRSLDVIVATHPDDDHVMGLVEVAERYRVDHLLTSGLEPLSDPAYEALLSVAREKGVNVVAVQTGQQLVIDDGVLLEVLHPIPGYWADSPNEMSVVTRLQYGELSVMLTGDAEAATEATLLASGANLQSTVLKAGHHGANGSSSAPFLAAVQPAVVVVSAGPDNRYGHPHPDALQRFAEVGASVLRTDLQGTLTLRSDGRDMWWEAEK